MSAQGSAFARDAAGRYEPLLLEGSVLRFRSGVTVLRASLESVASCSWMLRHLASLQNEALNLGLVQDLTELRCAHGGEELLWQLGQQASARIVCGFVSSTLCLTRVKTELPLLGS